MTTASALTKPAQIRLARRSPACWRVTIDNPPINVMGPEMVLQFQEVIDATEADEHVNRALPEADLDADVETRRRVGCVHCLARATLRPGWDQGAHGARLPQAGGCRKSARILPGPNRPLVRRLTRLSTPFGADRGGDASKVSGDVSHFLHEGGLCVSESERCKA